MISLWANILTGVYVGCTPYVISREFYLFFFGAEGTFICIAGCSFGIAPVKRASLSCASLTLIDYIWLSGYALTFS